MFKSQQDKQKHSIIIIVHEKMFKQLHKEKQMMRKRKKLKNKGNKTSLHESTCKQRKRK